MRKSSARVRITIEHANGERETFSLPRGIGFQIADTLCESGHLYVEVLDDGKHWALTRGGSWNPRWTRIPTDGVEHTRHSAATAEV